MEKKVCPACGNEFSCLHTAWCWCTAYKLSKNQLIELNSRYSNCLCPVCIQALNPKRDIPSADNFQFKLAKTEVDYKTTETLFREYALLIQCEHCFVHFEEELKILNQMYGAPNGGIILVWAGEDVIGCVAIRKMNEGIAELKRMYLKTEFRNFGLGKKLLKEAETLAKSLGYHHLYLDTMPKLKPAIHLYESAGFDRYTPSFESSVNEIIFFRKEL